MISRERANLKNTLFPETKINDVENFKKSSINNFYSAPNGKIHHYCGSNDWTILSDINVPRLNEIRQIIRSDRGLYLVGVRHPFHYEPLSLVEISFLKNETFSDDRLVTLERT